MMSKIGHIHGAQGLTLERRERHFVAFGWTEIQPESN